MPKFIADPHVLAVVAVGSAVRDVPAPSDVDFVIVWETAKPDLGRPPIDVDIRLFEHRQAAELIAAGNDYLNWAVRLGVLVADKQGFWAKFVKRWSGAAPWPDPNESERRASRAASLRHDLEVAGDRDAAMEQFVSELTHRGRAALLRAQVFPASRPELPAQLRTIGQQDLAEQLEDVLRARSA